MSNIVSKISIIIPVYNVEPYLRDCLDSVVNQTMQEIQIICVNDGSTDNSFEILEEYASRDSRFLIINKINAGVSSARNIGLAHSTGKYVLFVDSDDTVDIRLCEKVYFKAEQSNADFVLFFHDTPNGHTMTCDTTITPDDKIEWNEKKEIFYFATIWGKLWRNDCLKKYDLKFYEKLHYFDDSLFYWQGLLLTTKISIVPEFLYHYYVRENSIMTLRGKRFLEIFDLFAAYKSFLKDHGFYPLLQSIFLRLEIDLVFNSYRDIENEYKAEFFEKLKNWISNDEVDYMRRERYIDYSVTYFFYRVTGDKRIFLMYLRRRIRSFLGTSKRNLIKIFRTYVLKNRTNQIKK
jgi:glycosyltransferase involved in cell wall biosynthesis